MEAAAFLGIALPSCSSVLTVLPPRPWLAKDRVAFGRSLRLDSRRFLGSSPHSSLLSPPPPACSLGPGLIGLQF